MQARHRVRVNVTLPPRLIKEADAYARAYNTSRSAVIETALRRLLPTLELTRAERAALKFAHKDWSDL